MGEHVELPPGFQAQAVQSAMQAAAKWSRELFDNGMWEQATVVDAERLMGEAADAQVVLHMIAETAGVDIALGANAKSGRDRGRGVRTWQRAIPN